MSVTRQMDARAGAVAAPPGPIRCALVPRSECDDALRPLRAWSSLERGRAVAAVEAAWRSWCTAWGFEGGEPAQSTGAQASTMIRCEPLFEATAAARAPELGGWSPVSAEAAGAWWALTGAGGPSANERAARVARVLALVGRGLFGDAARGGPYPGALATAPRGVGEEVAQAAWADLWTRILGTPARGAAQEGPGPDPSLAGAWSGALVFTVPLREGVLALLLAHDVVARALGGAARSAFAGGGASQVTPVERALARRNTRVSARTKEFELELGALAGLRVGDVVRTSHPLEAPLTLHVELGGRPPQVLCAAFLGNAGGARAVELFPVVDRSREAGARPTDTNPTRPTDTVGQEIR